MTPDDFYAEAAREFLALHHVYRYRGKKVSEMTADECKQKAHWFTEENHLTDEWNAFLTKKAADYSWCRLFSSHIDADLCNEMQLHRLGYPSESTVYCFTKQELADACDACPHRYKKD